MKNDLIFQFEVYSEDYSNAGRASSEIKKYLNQLGFDSQFIRRVVISAYEAEMNIVIHSLGGQLELSVNNDKIILSSVDKGPGINDIELALTPGYSTANKKAQEMGFGAGMGLPNMKKNANEFFIESSKEGTKIKMSFTIEVNK